METHNILGAVGLLLLVLYAAWDIPGAIERDGERVTLRYAWWVRCYFLFAAFAIPVGITLLAIVKEPRDTGEMWSLCGLYALFGVLGVPSWWMTTRFALEISPAGLVCRSPWRGSRFVPWEKVDRLCQGEMVQWYILRSRDGYAFRFPYQCVPGLPLLLEEMKKHAPAALAIGEQA
jgi:hypothetical protein